MILVGTLVVAGTMIWNSLRAGVTDEQIIEGVSRAEAMSSELSVLLSEAGLALEIPEPESQGYSSCGGDLSMLGSSQLTVRNWVPLIRPVSNDEIISVLDLGNRPGWRSTGDSSRENQRDGGTARQVLYTNGDLGVVLLVTGNPETGTPFVQVQVSTSCYNNGVSGIEIGDYGPSGAKPAP